jgi:hypothetical protein
VSPGLRLSTVHAVAGVAHARFGPEVRAFRPFILAPGRLSFRVPGWFREGFYVGLTGALLIALFLLWLWRPERQVRYHSEHLLRAIEHKSWSAVAEFIAPDYRDQWSNDRPRLLERTREVLRYLRGLRVEASNVVIKIDNRRGDWIANIKIDGQPDEPMAAVKEQVNSLPTPFELEWRRVSKKPWDWKLVRVSNPTLQLPAEFE